MSPLQRVGLAVLLDLGAVVGAYLLAVLFRVGGRLETAQPETKTETAMSPTGAHRYSHQRASVRLTRPRPRLDMPGFPA